jgi:hypothetical protein
MFKTMMLILIASTGFVHSDDTGKTLALVAGASVVAGTGIYWAVRESNAVKMERAEKWLKYYASGLHYELVQIISFEDMQKFAKKPIRFKKEIQIFCDEVDRSYAEMDARYGSWIKPWNWTAEMKYTHARITELYQTMHLIKMIFKYQPLMISWNDDLDEATIVKNVQTVCQGTSSYPLCACAQMMKDDLAFLRKTHFKISCDITLIDMLERLLEFILGTQTYIEEKRIQDQAKIQERQARAQEAQVAAQLTQAKAQSDQARAQEQRNRIEQEKLNHEKKK